MPAAIKLVSAMHGKTEHVKKCQKNHHKSFTNKFDFDAFFDGASIIILTKIYLSAVYVRSI